MGKGFVHPNSFKVEIVLSDIPPSSHVLIGRGQFLPRVDNSNFFLVKSKEKRKDHKKKKKVSAYL
jgi:hypothetical protein